VYRKTHLFGAAERATFTPGCHLGGGDNNGTFRLRGVVCALLICYDVEFPEAARSLVLAGTQLLLVPTANFEPYDLVNLCVCRTRALENHVHVVYANWAGEAGGSSPPSAREEGPRFNGRSVVAGPEGELLLEFEHSERGVRVVELAPGARAAAGAEDAYLADRRPELYARTALTVRWSRLWRAELATLRVGCVCLLAAAALLKPAARRGLQMLWEESFARGCASVAELAARAAGRPLDQAAGGGSGHLKTTFSQRP